MTFFFNLKKSNRGFFSAHASPSITSPVHSQTRVFTHTVRRLVHICRQVNASTNMQLGARFCTVVANVLRSNRHRHRHIHHLSLLSLSLSPGLGPCGTNSGQNQVTASYDSFAYKSSFELQDYPNSSLSNSTKRVLKTRIYKSDSATTQ